MRQFVVSEAPASRVAHHVRETVEEAGGIVANHTSRKTEFDHLDYGEGAWRRAGYVGTYQRFKEKPVQVRIRVWAQWPRRLLTGSVYLGFAVAFVFFLLSLVELSFPPNVWIFTAIPILAAIAISFLMYTSSRSDSQIAEQRIENELVDRLEEDEEIPGEIYDTGEWEDYRSTLVDEARQDAKQRAPHGGSRVRGAMSSLGGSLGSGESQEEEAQADAETAGAEAGEDESPDGKEAEASTGSGPQGVLASLKDKLGLGDEDTDEPPEPDESEPGTAEGTESTTT